MTVGDLVKVLSHQSALTEEILQAQRSLLHGGSPSTMESKRAHLADLERQLEEFLALELSEAVSLSYL